MSADTTDLIEDHIEHLEMMANYGGVIIWRQDTKDRTLSAAHALRTLTTENETLRDEIKRVQFNRKIELADLHTAGDEIETLSAKAKELEEEDDLHMIVQQTYVDEIKRLTARLKRLGSKKKFSKGPINTWTRTNYLAEHLARIDYANNTWEKDDG